MTSVVSDVEQSAEYGRERTSYGDHWPRTIGEAYQRGRGPYTLDNAWVLLEEEKLELYNGWLVWQEMTDPKERRIAGTIQEILSLAARAAHFGQAYPDQFECKMKSGDTLKPDVSLISTARFSTRLVKAGPNKEHQVLQGGPELVVEVRSPSNRRSEERRKRRKYFENETLVVWDVDPEQAKVWVYELESQQQPQEYKAEDIITCERLLPGWQHKVADFFALELSAEQVVGQVAAQWREEGREEGQKQALLNVLLLQAGIRFGTALPADLAAHLNSFSLEQLTGLVTTIATSLSLEDWLATFPGD